MNAYDQHVTRLKNAWRDDDDDEREIVPDGHSIRVSIMTMDSVQQQIAAQDERVRDNQATLDSARRTADRVQAHVDHFTAQRVAQADNSAYGQHCQQLSEAWRQVAA